MMTDSPQMVWQSADEQSAQALAWSVMGRIGGTSFSETRRSYLDYTDTLDTWLRWEC